MENTQSQSWPYTLELGLGLVVSVGLPLLAAYGWLSIPISILVGALGMSLTVHGLAQLLRQWTTTYPVIAKLPKWLAWQTVVSCIWAGIASGFIVYATIARDIASPIDQTLNRQFDFGSGTLETVEIDGQKAAQFTLNLANKSDRAVAFTVEIFSVVVGNRSRPSTLKNAHEETLPPSSTKPYFFPLIPVDQIGGKEARIIISIVAKYRFSGQSTYRIARQTRNCIIRLTGDKLAPTCPYDINEDDQIAQE